MFEYWVAGCSSTHATLVLENRCVKVGRCIGRLEHKPEVLDSLKYFCGFIFLNILLLFPLADYFDICFEVKI